MKPWYTYDDPEEDTQYYDEIDLNDPFFTAVTLEDGSVSVSMNPTKQKFFVWDGEPDVYWNHKHQLEDHLTFIWNTDHPNLYSELLELVFSKSLNYKDAMRVTEIQAIRARWVADQIVSQTFLYKPIQINTPKNEKSDLL